MGVAGVVPHDVSEGGVWALQVDRGGHWGLRCWLTIGSGGRVIVSSMVRGEDGRGLLHIVLLTQRRCVRILAEHLTSLGQLRCL